MAGTSKKSSPEAQRPVKVGVHRGTAGWEAKSMQIREAALDLLIERGYGDMSMDEVAAKASVSKRTLYQHYGSKLDLAVDCIKSLPDWGGWGEGKDSLEQRLLRAMNAGASYRIRMPRVFATCLTHQREAPELMQALVEHVLLPRVESMREFIDHGVAFGDIHEDTDPVVAMAIIIGLLMFNDAGIVDFGESGPKLAQAVTDAVLPYFEA